MLLLKKESKKNYAINLNSLIYFKVYFMKNVQLLKKNVFYQSFY